MMVKLTENEAKTLLTTIESRLGLRFEGPRYEDALKVLHRRIEATGTGDGAGYARHIASPVTSTQEYRELAKELTIGETYFFRNVQQINAFREKALPAVAKAHPNMLRFLSAGCSSGEEPYTLAMTVLQSPIHLHDRVEVVGVDVNPAILQKAERGIYTRWSMRATSPELQQRFFETKGTSYHVRKEVRKRVSFQRANLAEPRGGFWDGPSFDVIFCRNVLIYFSLETIRSVIAALTRLLRPGGFLFLGHAENLRSVSRAYSLCNSHDVFYYRKLATPALHSTPVLGGDREDEGPSAFPRRLPSTPANTYPDSDWYGRVIEASRSINQILSKDSAAPAPAMDGPETPSEAIPPKPSPAPEPDPLPMTIAQAANLEVETPDPVGPLREAVLSQQYSDAEACYRALPDPVQDQNEPLFLLATALINAGVLDRAATVLERLRTSDEFNPAVYYLSGLQQEASGDMKSAAKMATTSVYLDHTFALGHLLLGRTEAENGHIDSARRALLSAQELLEFAEPEGLKLLAAGFEAQQLQAVCGSMLRSLERTGT